MGTYGTALLPLDPSDPDSPILSCETFNDGDARGTGIGLWASSAFIAEVAEASAALAGAVFIRDPSRGGAMLFCKDGFRIDRFASRVPVHALRKLPDSAVDAIRDAPALAPTRSKNALVPAFAASTVAEFSLPSSGSGARSAKAAARAESTPAWA